MQICFSYTLSSLTYNHANTYSDRSLYIVNWSSISCASSGNYLHILPPTAHTMRHGKNGYLLPEVNVRAKIPLAHPTVVEKYKHECLRASHWPVTLAQLYIKPVKRSALVAHKSALYDSWCNVMRASSSQTANNKPQVLENGRLQRL
jgi:hypothetical protein